MNTQWDAVVIGGGPGGSTFSTMISRWGRRVLVLEKETFPRYHIGESLLPANWRVFDAMGIGDQIRDADFVHKAGGTFIWGQNREPWTVYFGEVNDLPAARQVKREEFDKMLLEHAAKNGAEVLQGCTVQEVLFAGNRAVGVRYIDQDGNEQVAQSRWVVDASGQGKVIARRFGLVEYHPGFRNAAVWSYWENGKRQAGKDAGNILYVSHEHGWFWYIPLDNKKNLISVGTIIRPSARHLLKKKKLDEFYHAMLTATDVVPEMLANAKQISPVRAITDYSYCCSQLAGPGWILVGDSACFVDPILSSGVQLATYHGMFAALTLNTILQQPEWEAEALAYYEQQYKQQYNNFVQLCLNMYDTTKKSKEDYFLSAHRMVQPKVMGEPSANGWGENVDGRLAFIGLISGLPAEETQMMQMKLFALRKKAEAQNNRKLAFNSEESLNLIFELVVHRAKLQAGKVQRIGEELEDDSVLRLAPGVTVKDKFFLPATPIANHLQRFKAVENRFGDRFQLTREIETLLGLLNGQRTYREIERIFYTALQIGPDSYHEPFRNWVELLADYGIVEWQKL
ncbi:MAG: tryptophan 7-halogenase [Ktedonobacteraceae bacterium]|nr:tryptophan 7-halogenase [Ktedonobacteraceae bacterium]